MALSTRGKKVISQLGKAPRMGDIKKIAKEIVKDHELAVELWSQGEYHSRLLATLIFDKKSLTEEVIVQIASDLLFHDEKQRNYISDWLLANQLTKDKKLTTLIESWRMNESPVLRRWFWYHQARLRWMGRTPPPPNSAELLQALESDLGKEDSEVQWAMNFCAGWIGVYENKLRARCVRLGKKFELYKDEPVAKNCTPSYLPEFIKIEVEKRAL